MRQLLNLPETYQFCEISKTVDHRHVAECDRSLNTINPFTPPRNPDLNLEVGWRPREPLNPWAVYCTAIGLMYQFAIEHWSDSRIVGARTAKDDKRRVGIAVSNVGERATSQLTTEYAVRALYSVIQDMAEGLSAFCAVSVKLSKARLLIGYLAIQPTLSSNNNNDLNDTVVINNSTHTYPVQNDSTIIVKQDLMSESGEIIDPQDGLRISYKYDGDNIPVQDLCFAIFDGLAYTAQLDSNSPHSHVTAVSASGNFVIHIGGNGDPGTVLVAGHLKRTLYSLWSYLYFEEKRFESVDFSLHIGDKKFADGYMMRLSSTNSKSVTQL